MRLSCKFYSLLGKERWLFYFAQATARCLSEFITPLSISHSAFFSPNWQRQWQFEMLTLALAWRKETRRKPASAGFKSAKRNDAARKTKVTVRLFELNTWAGTTTSQIFAPGGF
jgi:hypothetical protein